jgi:hypothetical protein
MQAIGKLIISMDRAMKNLIMSAFIKGIMQMGSRKELESTHGKTDSFTRGNG